MTDQFEYFFEKKAQGVIDIDDIGDFTLSAINDDFLEWIIDVTTQDGYTTIKTLGPVAVDSDSFGESFSVSYTVMEYSEKRIHSYVDKFINDRYRLITQLSLVDREDTLRRMKDVVDNSLW